MGAGLCGVRWPGCRGAAGMRWASDRAGAAAHRPPCWTPAACCPAWGACAGSTGPGTPARPPPAGAARRCGSAAEAGSERCRGAQLETGSPARHRGHLPCTNAQQLRRRGWSAARATHARAPWNQGDKSSGGLALPTFQVQHSRLKGPCGEAAAHPRVGTPLALLAGSAGADAGCRPAWKAGGSQRQAAAPPAARPWRRISAAAAAALAGRPW